MFINVFRLDVFKIWKGNSFGNGNAFHVFFNFITAIYGIEINNNTFFHIFVTDFRGWSFSVNRSAW